MTVLVGYASAHGSTREIAERIGARLTELGCTADVVSLDSGVGPEAYSAVVLGSAVHSRRWLPAAEEYVRAPAGPPAPLGCHRTRTRRQDRGLDAAAARRPLR